ncbi:Predicted pyrophosphatase or phosphodiesterase, AlkP superfamily [Flaviramulus basaltis]|uniref:Predicted pyrophosphatase or phosphodiesterase, AlkP superfamily n=1 Tax=Flaviramulus basaltis TaxID=369401 RepID=A0A1K2IHK5_9FLAO|nr:ectonucleotide pyrophosphatase/phosphodiesterase [Flaviramulus basaltis]SFZ91782.1 Predicted pyrophosphatase or phosphodiesterase, AlkP superfamily [Flaviramulus basaltis]
MFKKNFIYVLILIVSAITLSSCKSGSSLTESTLTENSNASIQKPYVILISLDGFRWDYVDKYKPQNLTNFINSGVKSESLISSFPSKTFPNHYTIATGMYPDKQGIIGNSFYSYKKNTIYKMGNREMVEDGTFYGGSPIWVQADKANMVSASYFFVGSEANIQGLRPTYYHHYDGEIKNNARVKETLKWLALPKKQRPHIITLYFSDMDNVGHTYGPDNDEKLKKTLFDLDKNLGDLFKGVKATNLPVNIIIVSDHGMATQKASNFISIENIDNKNLFTLIDNGAILNIHPKNNISTDSIIQYLKPKENHFKVYKTENTPGFEYTPKNRDWGTVQIIPDLGYYFSSNQRIEYMKKNAITTVGVHGYNPEYKDMHGIFYAKGPAFKKGFVLPSIKNINIYPLMCEILGLDIPDDIDGDLNKIKSVLKNDD